MWKIAAVQMNCQLGNVPANLAAVRARFRGAAAAGARLVLFPECVLSGYGFESKEEAWPHAEPLPGPATEALAADCRAANAFAAFGLLERDGDRLFNACALVGPAGLVASYRKAHLPCLGVDRFTTPGDRPFAVHDLGGLRVGLTICYDGSFPEASRVLTLLGADLIALPTNWPTDAWRNPRFVVQTRALENHVYYAAVNRVGEERGFRFIGQSRIVDCSGDLLAATGDDGEAVLVAEIDPTRARNKRVVNVPGKYEVDRVGDRRPELYGRMTER
ncbi:MAG TPA: carbon-nitrogen hydrolase family protein [Gemmataceae bacterium]|nr:carbon-nitrogen hydrolase family protein [Gemmataceae bacterium]